MTEATDEAVLSSCSHWDFGGGLACKGAWWRCEEITYIPVLRRNNTRFYVDLGVGSMPEIALLPVKFLRKFRQV